MKTPGRFILTLSALILFIAGGAALFAADEVARLLDPAPSRSMPLMVQLAGSGSLGFAALNWMSRGNRIGGIYARPTGIGNLLLFLTAALSLGKPAISGDLPLAVTVVAATFALLAVSFAWLVFVHDPLAETA
ncbi:hypothetical protein LZ016_14305 [Sphingomonas sp. SM33]|uniref:Uncharacterized protein n=1 Tax=Sphingomonas telluris TaxID=2907998 RepID=A0ABS9VQK1_9SPHN|nr:hypothetical protein [Sphingomonas telluris]MCH8617266.1 hypothetical protein [Sphingomonas telluris]